MVANRNTASAYIEGLSVPIQRKGTARSSLTAMVSLDSILGDNYTAVTKNGSLVQVIECKGLPLDRLPEQQVDQLLYERQTLLETLHEDLVMSWFSIRTPITIAAQCDNISWPNLHTESVATRWREALGTLYQNTHYIILTLAQGDMWQSVTGLPSQGLSKEQRMVATRLALLTEISERMVQFLNAYDAQLMPMRVMERSDDMVVFPSALSVWSYWLNGGQAQPIARQTCGIDRLLATSDIEVDEAKRQLVFTDVNGDKRYGAMLGINSYPHETHIAMLQDLFALPRAFSVVQHVYPNTVEDSKTHIRKLFEQSQSLSLFMQQRSQELAEVGTALEAGDMVVQYHCLTIAVWATSEAELVQAIRDIQSVLLKHAILLLREGRHLAASYWGQLPDGAPLLASRKALISSINIAHFMYFAAEDHGVARTALGQGPVVWMRTHHDTPFGFTFHASAMRAAAGHTVMIGGTGSGKSTLMAFWLMHCMRYQGGKGRNPLRILSFDSGSGLKIPTMAFGGKVMEMGHAQGTMLNPMQLPDNVANRDFLIRWLELLAGSGSSGLVGTKESSDYALCAEIIRQNYDVLAHEERSLHHLRALFHMPTALTSSNAVEPFALRMEKWLPSAEDPQHSDYPFGLLFNALQDQLYFDHQWVTIDMAEVLKNPLLLAPLTTYLFHCFNQHISAHPAPHILFIDEVAQYLHDPLFGPYVLKAVREQRKKDGVVVMAAQEASVFASQPIGLDVIQNAETYLLFSAPAADKALYQELFQLTDSELHWVTSPTSIRQVLIKRKDGRSVIIQCDLRSLGSWLGVFSGLAHDLQLAEQCGMSADIAPEAWVNPYRLEWQPHG